MHWVNATRKETYQRVELVSLFRTFKFARFSHFKNFLANNFCYSGLMSQITPWIQGSLEKGVGNVSFPENFAYILNGWPLTSTIFISKQQLPKSNLYKRQLLYYGNSTFLLRNKNVCSFVFRYKLWTNICQMENFFDSAQQASVQTHFTFRFLIWEQIFFKAFYLDYSDIIHGQLFNEWFHRIFEYIKCNNTAWGFKRFFCYVNYFRFKFLVMILRLTSNHLR